MEHSDCHVNATSSTVASPREERAAYIASLGFPLLVILGGLLGFFFSSEVKQGASLVNPLLGIVMFGMGLSLKPVDFALVFRRPFPVILGVVAQYILMPTAALIVVWILRLPADIAAGVILVGCAPGGTSSNVVSYLARGDVALSVTMTSISTLLAPILTPFLTLWLAGQYMPLNGTAMALSIVQVVLIPVIAGLVLRTFIPRMIDRILPFLPWISVVAIAMIVSVVVAGARDNILRAGLIVALAVILHNLLGYGLGYLCGLLTKQPVPVRRTMSIEVGMQNSGLAAGLANQYMSPLSALPGAIFSVWHNLSGALLAALCRKIDNASQHER
ncbi:bile acid:sodium symporter family protein [Corynebacterium sp. 3HC-13]|uniref:bile acid:sodium symporter family protein n=1 Tax=Corynebacterium poyangense TaxID=2684405 RepID=UPI001CCD8E2B|nr:bile acid:sodium symporter family protein [Corynebacterium poyangense]MBZ8177117.1 bile acid:sodium symporter family protein [Corynebacterium poyangense]